MGGGASVLFTRVRGMCLLVPYMHGERSVNTGATILVGREAFPSLETSELQRWPTGSAQTLHASGGYNREGRGHMPQGYVVRNIHMI